MARNLRKGSRVSFVLNPKFPKRKIKGVVIKKFTIKKGTSGIPIKSRTIVEVRAVNSVFIKIPKELKRRRK